MIATRFLFRSLLSLLLFYTFFVCTYVSFFKKTHFNFLIPLFGLTAAGLFAVSLKSVFQKKRISALKSSLTKSRKSAYGLLALCLISLSVGFFNVHSQFSRGIVTDETGQHGISRNIPKKSYEQQQPPLDYYFSAFSTELFGYNKFAVRFHAMLFYLLLSLAVPLGLYYFCSSLPIAAVGSLLFLINHVIRLHSVYGRPQSLALFTGFLFLFFYLLRLDQKRPAGKMDFFEITASQYLFVMSIGLQPVIFILSLFLSSFLLLFRKATGPIFRDLFLSHVMTAILTAPFYLKMLFFAQSSEKFKQTPLSALKSHLLEFDVSVFFDTYFLSFYKQLLPFFLLLFITAGFVCLKKPPPKRTALIFCSTLLFPIIYDLIFNSWIRWNLHDRYFIVLSLFLILSAVMALKFLNDGLRETPYKHRIQALLFAVFLFSVPAQIKAIKEDTRFHHPYKDNSAEQVYDYLKTRGETKDLAFDFSLRPVVSARRSDISFVHDLLHNPAFHPVFIDFYVKYYSEPPYFWQGEGDLIYYIDFENTASKKNQKIFFIVLSDEDKTEEKKPNQADSALSDKNKTEEENPDQADSALSDKNKTEEEKPDQADSALSDKNKTEEKKPDQADSALSDKNKTEEKKPDQADSALSDKNKTEEEEEENPDQADSVLSGFMKGMKMGEYTVFEWIFPGKTDRETEYKQLLSSINRKTPKKYRGALYETLLHYAHKAADDKEFNRLLEEYRGLESALDEFLPGNINYPSRFELRRRVKYFENLKRNRSF